MHHVVGRFSALHGMPAQTHVCPSVCPSVKRVNCDKKEKICPDFYTIGKVIYPSFRRRTVGGGRPLIPEILGQPAAVGAKSPILNQYSLVASQP